MNISERLKCAAGYVSKGSITADVGCDHAYTSIYLVENKVAPHVYALDINDGPVSIARNNVMMRGHENSITVIKSDGLDKIKPEYGVRSVIISGMGGCLITGILTRADIRHNIYGELILQPQSDAGKVRHFLHDNGYRIDAEDMVFEDNKYYVIIKAVPGVESYAEEWEYEYGRRLAEKENAVFMNYLTYMRGRYVNIIDSLVCVRDKTKAQTDTIGNITHKIKVIDDILGMERGG